MLNYTTPQLPIDSFFYGLLLGDGSLNNRGILTIEHSSKNKDYVFWKHKKAQERGWLTENNTPKFIDRYDKKYNRNYQSYRFNTRSCFREQRNVFYKRGEKNQIIKQIPPQLDYLLTPESLAIWFMDDGGKGNNTKYGLIINLSGFTAHDQAKFQGLLQTKFSIETTLYQPRKHQRSMSMPEFWYSSTNLPLVSDTNDEMLSSPLESENSLSKTQRCYMYFKRSTVFSFVDLIRPYVYEISSMKYKIDQFPSS